MAKVKDPVCGMRIDAGAAAGTSSTGGQVHYFCSTQCKQKFDANPGQYAVSGTAGKGTVGHGDVLERNLTKKSGMTAPRFGAAGSGGLEFEGPPGRSGE